MITIECQFLEETSLSAISLERYSDSLYDKLSNVIIASAVHEYSNYNPDEIRCTQACRPSVYYFFIKFLRLRFSRSLQTLRALQRREENNEGSKQDSPAGFSCSGFFFRNIGTLPTRTDANQSWHSWKSSLKENVVRYAVSIHDYK